MEINGKEVKAVPELRTCKCCVFRGKGGNTCDQLVVKCVENETIYILNTPEAQQEYIVSMAKYRLEIDDEN